MIVRQKSKWTFSGPSNCSAWKMSQCQMSEIHRYIAEYCPRKLRAKKVPEWKCISWNDRKLYLAIALFVGSIVYLKPIFNIKALKWSKIGERLWMWHGSRCRWCSIRRKLNFDIKTFCCKHIESAWSMKAMPTHCFSAANIAALKCDAGETMRFGMSFGVVQSFFY